MAHTTRGNRGSPDLDQVNGLSVGGPFTEIRSAGCPAERACNRTPEPWSGVCLFYEFACTWMLSFCLQNTDKATPEYYFERVVASFIICPCRIPICRSSSAPLLGVCLATSCQGLRRAEKLIPGLIIWHSHVLQGPLHECHEGCGAQKISVDIAVGRQPLFKVSD